MISKKDENIYNKIRYGDCKYIHLKTKRSKDNNSYLCKIIKRDFTEDDQNNGFLKLYVTDISGGAHCYNFNCFLHWRTRSYYHPRIINDESELLALIL